MTCWRRAIAAGGGRSPGVGGWRERRFGKGRRGGEEILQCEEGTEERGAAQASKVGGGGIPRFVFQFGGLVFDCVSG